MGYKLAGYDVIGNVEIDPAMMAIYEKNLRPRFPFLMDIRDFLKIPDADLPPELFGLDVLDGSPPCTTFSTAGEREKNWGKEKKFREGQKEQRLDDLFFEFIRVAEKLKPKIVIAENVKGLILGNARGYVNQILKAFQGAGYETQLFLLNAAEMGVPQMRERVFFLARRKNLALPKITLDFKEPPILFGEVRSPKGDEPNEGIYKELLKQRIKTDDCIADIYLRVHGRFTGFANHIDHDDRVAFTNTSGGSKYRFFDAMLLSKNDYINTQTFPQDYDFGNQSAKYICGMSVPPVMMAQISTEVHRQWLMT